LAVAQVEKAGEKREDSNVVKDRHKLALAVVNGLAVIAARGIVGG
jgi:hypothetical protein